MRYWIVWVSLVMLMAACAPMQSPPSPTETPLPPTATPELPTRTAVILPTPTESQNGILQGKVTVGPLTPVVRLDAPTPVPPPETYTTRGIYIFLEDGKTAVQKVMFLGDGTYRVELPPGRYYIDYVIAGKDRAKNLPKLVVVQKGKVTTLDIDIDTGIR